MQFRLNEVMPEQMTNNVTVSSICLCSMWIGSELLRFEICANLDGLVTISRINALCTGVIADFLAPISEA